MPLFMFFSSLFIKLYGFHGSFTATIIQHPQKVARFCHQVPNRCLFCAWKHWSAWNHQFSLLCNLHCHKYSWLGDLVSPIKPYKNHCLSFEGEVIMCPNVVVRSCLYTHSKIPHCSIDSFNSCFWNIMRWPNKIQFLMVLNLQLVIWTDAYLYIHAKKT